MSKRIIWAAADGAVDEVDELESAAHQILMGPPDSLGGWRRSLREAAAALGVEGDSRLA